MDPAMRSMEFRVRELENRNRELNIALMRKSAEASEVSETLKRWRTELEILSDQKGHNLCWAGIPRLLKATIGHTGKYPDLENVSGEQFAHGCAFYHKDLFPDCGVRLEVIKSDQK